MSISREGRGLNAKSREQLLAAHFFAFDLLLLLYVVEQTKMPLWLRQAKEQIDLTSG
jgi:hypothetical protein